MILVFSDLQDKKPYIDVDEFQNTKIEGVYALGDVCGPVELTPTAIAAGRRLADRLFGNLPESKADYDFVPTVCINAHRILPPFLHPSETLLTTSTLVIFFATLKFTFLMLSILCETSCR